VRWDSFAKSSEFVRGRVRIEPAMEFVVVMIVLASIPR